MPSRGSGNPALQPPEPVPERRLNQAPSQPGTDRVGNHIGDFEAAVLRQPLQKLQRHAHGCKSNRDAELEATAAEDHPKPERQPSVSSKVRELVPAPSQVHFHRDERQDDDRGDHSPAQQQPNSPVAIGSLRQLHGIQLSGSSQTISPTATCVPATTSRVGPSFVTLTAT